VDGLRFPLAARGYRMADVDDALSRLGAELAERDARIADLESALAGARSGSAHAPVHASGENHVSMEKPAPRKEDRP
jgi:DivIVA domain-containing protein